MIRLLIEYNAMKKLWEGTIYKGGLVVFKSESMYLSTLMVNMSNHDSIVYLT